MSKPKANGNPYDAKRAGHSNSTDKSRRRVVVASLAVLVPGLIAPPRPANGQEVEQSGRRATSNPLIDVRPASKSMSLDGLAFSGPTGAVGMAPHHQEILEFQGGLLSSSECEKWGFRPARYKAWTDGPSVRFEAKLYSKTYGEITWEGEITNQIVSAHYHWRKERLFWTLRNSYWFTGERHG